MVCLLIVIAMSVLAMLAHHHQMTAEHENDKYKQDDSFANTKKRQNEN
tara:strand:+ start:6459 stop:6602 length:144 start_codon:yes stop_codon:yes gene_type:complete